MKRKHKRHKVRKISRMKVAVCLQKAKYYQRQSKKFFWKRTVYQENLHFLQKIERHFVRPKTPGQADSIRMPQADWLRLSRLAQPPEAFLKACWHKGERVVGGLSFWKRSGLFLAVLSLLVVASVRVVEEWWAWQSPIYEVSGHSMAPTLKEGERYHLKKEQKIARYDLVVFRPSFTDELYLKRVIGLPGEQFSYKNGQLWINQRKQADAFASKTADFDFAQAFHHQTIPLKSYVVLGDNRQNSFDSRNFGWVRAEQIVGILDQKNPTH